MYEERKIEARSCNHCCGVNAITVTYSECGFAALRNQHGIRMRPIVIRVLLGSIIFYNVISQNPRFKKKRY